MQVYSFYEELEMLGHRARIFMATEFDTDSEEEEEFEEIVDYLDRIHSKFHSGEYDSHE